MSGVMGAGLLACVLSGDAGATTEAPAEVTAATVQATTASQPAIGAPTGAFDAFLDRLMRAESNGRDTAANPRSTALGAFQFIKSTFLDVMRRNFSADVANMNESDILALRTDRGFARRAAEAFSKENLDYLAERGLKPTFGHLRLAFLLGPVGAARVLEAPPGKAVSEILDDRVIAANPFMRRMSAADLIARAHRDVGGEPPAVQTAEAAVAAVPQPASETPASEAPASEPPAREAGAAKPARREMAAPRRAAARPAARSVGRAVAAERGRTSSRTAVINVKCNSKLASCQRWIDLQVARIAKVADRTEANNRRDRRGA
jgi:hypothetical protein